MRHTPRHTLISSTHCASNARLPVAALSIATLTLCALLPAMAQPHGPLGDPQGGPGPRHGGDWEQGGRGGPRGGMMPDWGGPQERGGARGNGISSTPLEALTLHHQQGIALANLAATKSTRSDLKKFAQRLITAQTSQLAQLKALQGASIASPSSTSTNRPNSPMMRGRAFGGRGGPVRGEEGRNEDAWNGEVFGGGSGASRGRAFMPQGTDKAAQLSSATDFDRSFLQTMIGYQAESILAAQAALQNNATPQVTTLANQIVSQSAANLAQLSEWNHRWYKDR